MTAQILSNLVDGILEVVNSMPGNNEEMILMLRSEKLSGRRFLSPELAEMLSKLIYDDPQFQLTRKDPTVQLQDCWPVYAEELKQYPAWGGQGWVPSLDDCIRSRARTNGVIKEEVMIETVPFVLYDVGGQRSERRKWMHMFENVTASIFVVALSEYDQVLFEDRSKNRLEEALELFSECVNSAWLKESTMLLFLNKMDLFTQKYLVDKVPLNKSGLFPTAPTSNNNAQEALAWFTKIFQAKCVSKRPSQVYVHVTTATDPKNVQTVFKMCRDTILTRNMKMSGFAV